MIQLRPYQEEAVDLVQEGFRLGHRRIVLCHPTGSGKSVLTSRMVAKAAQKGTRCLILADRLELFKQNFAAVERAGITPEVLEAKTKHMPDANIVVGMVETVKRRLDKLKLQPQLMILDEAHKQAFNRIIEHFPFAYTIGATATPIGPHFYKYYTHIVQNVTIPFLVENGWLVPCKAYQMVGDLSGIKVVAGEYEEKALFAHYDKPKMYKGVVDEYQKTIPGKKTLVFNVNIEHSYQMTEQFNLAGIHSECITSETHPDDRVMYLRAFHEGRFPVLNNCGVLTTGYDEPSIEAIVVNRATMSLPLWLQMLGRGSRPFPGKFNFIALDFGLNHDRHGLWQEDREWAISPNKKKGPAQPAPIKKCPQCQAMLHASVSLCTYCGYIYPISDKAELSEGYLVEVKANPLEHLKGRTIASLTIPELIECEKYGRFKVRYVWRIVRTRGIEALREYASLKGYNGYWASNQMKEGTGVNTTSLV